MKLLLIAPNFPPMSWPCGAAHFCQLYALNLRDNGYDVTVLTSNQNAQSLDDIPIEIIPGHWDLKHTRRVASWINCNQFDLIDFQYEASMFGFNFASILLPLMLKRSAGKRILTLHSPALPRWGGRLWRPLQVFPYSGVFFYTDKLKERFLKRFRSYRDRFSTAPFPANIVRLSTPRMQQQVARIRADMVEDSIFIYFGHINAHRGIEEMLAAFSRLKDRNFHIYLISKFEPQTNAYQRSLLEMSESLEIREKVTFTGSLSDQAVSIYFDAADCAVLPFQDGASFKNGSLATAISHACPVITTIAANTDSPITNSPGVLGYTAGDIDALTELLSNAMDGTQAMRGAISDLNEHVSWDNYLSKRIEFYDRVSKHA